MTEKIIKNSVKCHKCEEEIESLYGYDFKWCKCGNVAVDGGHNYLRRCFQTGEYTDTSIVVDTE